MFKNTSIAIMYAVTPCHAGSGSALGVVDLPIQREKHTNWPMIQASGVKGAFRANFDTFKCNIKQQDQVKEFDKITDSIFGSDKGGKDGSGYAGSSSFGDARILAYPMRSNVAPFVWITCPGVLKRLEKDLEIIGKTKFNASAFKTEENNAVCLAGKMPPKVLLEDCEVNVTQNPIAEFSNITEYFKDADRLLLVSDDVFNYGVSYCTQIMAQIKIDADTGTTHEGSLRYQEELPSDTIMYTIIHWGDSKGDKELKDEMIKKFVTEEVIKNHIQIAGDETCGRGIFKLEWK